MAGHWRGDGVGIVEEKSPHGGPRGMAGAAADRRWGVVSGRRGGAEAPSAAGGRGRQFGRWWLAAQGVEVEDELQALDFVSNGCKID